MKPFVENLEKFSMYYLKFGPASNPDCPLLDGNVILRQACWLVMFLQKHRYVKKTCQVFSNLSVCNSCRGNSRLSYTHFLLSLSISSESFFDQVFSRLPDTFRNSFQFFTLQSFADFIKKRRLIKIDMTSSRRPISNNYLTLFALLR